MFFRRGQGLGFRDYGLRLPRIWGLLSLKGLHWGCTGIVGVSG